MKYSIKGFLIDLMIVTVVFPTVLSIVNHNSINKLRYQEAVRVCESNGGEIYASMKGGADVCVVLPLKSQGKFVDSIKDYQLKNWSWVSESKEYLK